MKLAELKLNLKLAEKGLVIRRRAAEVLEQRPVGLKPLLRQRPDGLNLRLRPTGPELKLVVGPIGLELVLRPVGLKLVARTVGLTPEVKSAVQNLVMTRRPAGLNFMGILDWLD